MMTLLAMLDDNAVPDPFASMFGDTDLDGIPDWWEQGHGLDPFANDSTNDDDNDGLQNLYEFLARTDPMLPDTDFDGILDGEEPDGDATDFDDGEYSI